MTDAEDNEPRRLATSSMLVRTRRFLVLMGLSFAFGGFLFYAGVVVPIGTSVLGATTQGFVTRQVTGTLNMVTLGAMALMAWDVWAAWSARSRVENKVLVLSCVIILTCSAVLIPLHGFLSQMLSTEDFAVEDTQRFYGFHQLYLWTSTVQWLCSLPVFWLIANSPRGEQSGDSLKG